MQQIYFDMQKVYLGLKNITSHVILISQPQAAVYCWPHYFY